MRLISAQEAANKWGITKRRVLTLCATNRIKDAELVGNIWVLPADAEKPEDARIKQPLESDDRATIKSARNSLKNVCQSSIRVLILNYSCTSGTASENGCALSDSCKADNLTSFPLKKGALRPSMPLS